MGDPDARSEAATQPVRPSRRNLLTYGVATAAGVVAGTTTAPPVVAAPATEGLPDGPGAWQRLQAGNARFVAGRQRHPHQDPERRKELAEEQAPFACVLGCADSRVPPEMVFDRGLGDPFTVRSAGQVLDDAVLGSVEYAVAHLTTPLLVVLGHSGCGAVQAAVDLVDSDTSYTGYVSTLVRQVEAAVRATPEKQDEEEFLAACVALQAERVADLLAERSEIVRDAVEHGQVTVVPAVYDLASGRVDRLR